MRVLDSVDKKILLALDTDARAAYAQIAKRTHLGKNNVQYRIARLIEDGVIKKFVTQFSLGTLGLMLGKIYLQLSGMTKEEEKELTDYLLHDPRISWIAKTEGRYDLMIGSYVENLHQFNTVKNDFFKRFERYVTAYDVVFLVEGHTSPRAYLSKSRQRRIEKFIGNQRITITDEEKKILRFIANTARFSYVDLAQHCGITAKTAMKKVKGLEEQGVIQGYVTFLNPAAYGYAFFKLIIHMHDYHASLPSFLSYCKELPNVIHVIETLGPWEIELELECLSVEDLYTSSHEIRNAFPTIIKKVESVIIIDEPKLDFFPEWY
jgi:DNA-binding Lrp family transcriptional regulator